MSESNAKKPTSDFYFSAGQTVWLVTLGVLGILTLVFGCVRLSKQYDDGRYKQGLKWVPATPAHWEPIGTK